MKALLDEQELLQEFKEELAKAARFHIGMALLTKKGVDHIYASMARCLRQGGRGEILIGIDLPTEPRAIKRLCNLKQRFTNGLDLRLFLSGERVFHPKFSIFSSKTGAKTAIVGSSNLTEGGMSHNYETNILVNDPRLAQRFLDYFQEHFEGSHSTHITADWLRKYEGLWAQRAKLINLLRQLREKARKRSRPVGRPLPTRIHGYCFAFTGRMHGWPRQRKLYPTVRRYGGKVAESADQISASDCLVHAEILGGRTSTLKLRRARKEQIPIVTEEDFLKILSNEKRAKMIRKVRSRTRYSDLRTKISQGSDELIWAPVAAISTPVKAVLELAALIDPASVQHPDVEARAGVGGKAFNHLRVDLLE